MHLQRRSNQEFIPLKPGEELGSGGEARVFTVPSEGKLVAKVYYQASDINARKLAVMLANPPSDPTADRGHISLAWPIDLLTEDQPQAEGRGKQTVGFLMPHITDSRLIINYYNPKTRRQLSPLFNYRYLHRTAYNLAAIVGSLHERGYVIGDINESNILVTETALVTIVDTDSFQVRDPETGIVYRCPVRKPEFTPPELQGKNYSEIDQTPEHDLFGLGVLIFQLLMEGTHPFAGVYQGEDDPPPIEARIAAGQFPYGNQNVGYSPMPLAPALEILDPKLQRLFIRCFQEGYLKPEVRPDAQTWQKALKEAENALVTCGVNDQHQYGRHLNNCPWCDRAQRLGGRDPFPSLEAVQQGQHLELKPKLKAKPKPQAISAIATYNRPINRVLTGHSRGVLCVAFSPNGRTLASSSYDNTIKIWNLLSGKLIRTLKDHTGAIKSLAFSPDGQTLASGSNDATIKIWQLDSGKVLHTLWGHGDSINSVAFSPDGQTLVSGSWDKTIKIWNPHIGKLLRTLEGHSGAIRAVAISPDGKTIASGSSDSNIIPGLKANIKIWNLDSGKLLYTITNHSGPINSVAFSPDSKTLATANQRGSVKIWDLENGKLIYTFRDHLRAVNSIAFSPDGQTLATGGDDRTIKIWDLDAGKLINTFKTHSDAVNSLAFSPNGQNLATGSSDKTIAIQPVPQMPPTTQKFQQNAANRSSFWKMIIFLIFLECLVPIFVHNWDSIINSSPSTNSPSPEEITEPTLTW